MTGETHQFSWNYQPRPDKRCLVIRYGGYGDMIQTASVFPQIKEQGWHLTVNTAPAGYEACKHDPHVDGWIVQDKNQVPNRELEAYWMALGKEYDRVINLCESIEGALLAIPGRRNHAMSFDARHRMMDVNYLEWLHMLAEVPFAPAAVFYPTDEETARMREVVDGIDKPLVVWALAGSSVHKVWPWVEIAVQTLLENGVSVMLVGGPECQMLELGVMQTLVLNNFGIDYETSNDMPEADLITMIEKRFGPDALLPMSGKLGIRQSLTLAGLANVVVGPETGVLNAVGLNEDVHKVVFLSHSSEENLTKHWRATTAIRPSVGCFPCHRLHYDSTHCPRDEETGASVCAASINSANVASAIMQAIGGARMRKAG